MRKHKKFKKLLSRKLRELLMISIRYPSESCLLSMECILKLTYIGFSFCKFVKKLNGFISFENFILDLRDLE